MAVVLSAMGSLLSATVRASRESVTPGVEASDFLARSGPSGVTMFRALAPAETGIETVNSYSDPRMWAERYRELELGAVGTGVAIGDYDGDGRPDVLVVSKTESCRLFRNLGGMRFEDVTQSAGVGDRGEAAGVWKQGATFVDVNNDGRLDLYVCRFAAPNLLYINQGDGTFREEAVKRGLAVVDASVMGAFCDYDRDGALDVLVQTNLLDGKAHPQGQRNYLLHNDGRGYFTNVTDRAGITGEGQGHSAAWWDYDSDGWPDLYVANDFAPADKLYRNNGDGTFTDVIDEAAPHTPASSMGSDQGDINNDGHIDLLVADMAATTHEKDQRSMVASRDQNVELADPAIAPQYPRNMLLLGTGTRRCLEGAYLAGLAATDWTWSVRFEDLDNDGRLDLHITNGMIRESHNTDLLARMMTAENQAEKTRLARATPVLAEPNLAFRNLGDLRFQNVSAEWGLNERGVSFGAAFGDFDGDGDLDLVYANYQKGASVLRNDSQEGGRVIFALSGRASNRFGVGSRVEIETDAGIQVRQLVLARGALSSSEPVLHFGTGQASRIRRVTVHWPSGRRQVITDLPVDRKYTMIEPDAVPEATITPEAPRGQFRESGRELGLAIPARELPIDELSQQPLLPLRQNRRGPSVAIGAVDASGRDAIIFGGTGGAPTRFFVPGGDGNPSFALTQGANSLNDGPLLIFDADGDGSQDLLVTKAGVARPAGAPDYQPRLFLGDGQGGFGPAPGGSLPDMRVSVGAVAAADFDRDGRLDLFIGGRVQPGLYPLAPRSALLVNRGGRFEDVTSLLAQGLREVGMVTSALWSDVDQDGWPDLIVTTEWGPVRCFRNREGSGFEDWKERLGFSSAGTGWWQSLAGADFNGDGRIDYVIGNVGLNTQYRASAAQPALLFAGDFIGDGGMQLIEGYHEGDRLFPWRSRRVLAGSIPSILRRYPRNDIFARAELKDILGADELAAAERFAVTELRSGVLLSQTDGNYRFTPLPRLAQIAPLQGVVAGDFDGDSRADIYAIQNSYSPVPTVGRFDGGLSVYLKGDGQGAFSPESLAANNLVVPGDAKALAVLDLNTDGWPDFVATRNNDTSLAFLNQPVLQRNSLAVVLRGKRSNPTAVGSQVWLTLSDGSRQSAEVYAGSGYHSQSSATLFFGWPDTNPPRTVTVRWPDGSVSAHDASSCGQLLVLETRG